MGVVFQKNHYNVVGKQNHKFGICPISPLHLYNGKPVYWDIIPDDFQVHTLVTASVKSIFWLPGFLLHYSLIYICRYLSKEWDVQLPNLLEYSFPFDASQDSHFIFTESSALQNNHHI